MKHLYYINRASRHLLSSIISIAIVLVTGVTANAQVTDAMDRKYELMKGYSTSTPAGHYQGQTQNVFTLGSFSYRQEQENYQIASLNLPKMKSGCGGIDIFKGGFSFIGGDQLKAMMRNILQNATTYAFKLAIDTVSPLIGKVMGELTALVEDVNSMNISSCEAAMKGVDSLVTNLHGALGTTCAQMGADKGIFSDSYAGRVCSADDLKAREVEAAKNTDEKKASPVNKNYAFEATAGHSLYGTDLEMREFLMSITGTQILKIETDGTIKVKYIPPIALDDGVITSLMEGGNVTVHGCDEAVACLNPNPSKNILISATDGYRTRVDDVLTSLYDKTVGTNSSPITEDEKRFVEETTIPILKAIDVYSQALPSTGRVQILAYSDMIAYDMVLKFLVDSTNEVLDGGHTITGGEGKSLQEWRAGVSSNRMVLYEKQANLSDRFSASIKFIDHIKSLEAGVAARLITVVNDNSDNGVGSR